MSFLEAWRDDRRKDAKIALKELYLGDLDVVFDAARANNGRNVLILEQRYGSILHLMEMKIKTEEGEKAIMSLKTTTLSHLEALEPNKSDHMALNDE